MKGFCHSCSKDITYVVEAVSWYLGDERMPRLVTSAAAIGLSLPAGQLVVPVRGYDLLVKSTATENISFYHQPILDGSTQKYIGEMYQSPLYNISNENRVGINQGYGFSFNNGTEFNRNDIYFLDGI